MAGVIYGMRFGQRGYGGNAHFETAEERDAAIAKHIEVVESNYARAGKYERTVENEMTVFYNIKKNGKRGVIRHYVGAYEHPRAICSIFAGCRACNAIRTEEEKQNTTWR